MTTTISVRTLPPTRSLQRLEEALGEAATLWARRIHLSADPVRRAADALLARLGLDPSSWREGAAPPAPVLDTLRRENRRLCRQATRGDARYDMNRHIAVMRLLRGAEPVLPAPAFRETRQPGAALNRRFRRGAERGEA